MTTKEWEDQRNDLVQKFKKVCSILQENNNHQAYRLAFIQPWRFYKEHSVMEAVNILLVLTYIREA